MSGRKQKWSEHPSATPQPMPTDKRFIDLTGRVFGRLCAMFYVGRTASGGLWHCQCTCGRWATLATSNFKYDRQISCGCYRREVECSHEETRMAEYTVWKMMKDRCSNKRSRLYVNYGGRGIAVCEQWRGSFRSFLNDMGHRPSSKHSIERVDNNGHYEPRNCRWATMREQLRNKRNNRRLTYDGKTMCLSAWAEHVGLPRYLLSGRLNRGWTPEAVLTTPINLRFSRPSKPRC